MTNIRTTRTGEAIRPPERHLKSGLKFGVICLSIGALAACETDVNPIENLVRSEPPDEFAVIERAPLVIPKSTSLPEPAPGEPSRVDPDPLGDAILALTGRTQGDLAAAQTSAGEQALLGAADTAAADPTIRAQLEQDNAGPGEDEPYEPPSIVELFLEPGEKPADPGTLLDPDREARRLQTGGISSPVNPDEEPPESGATGGDDSTTR